MSPARAFSPLRATLSSTTRAAAAAAGTRNPLARRTPLALVFTSSNTDTTHTQTHTVPSYCYWACSISPLLYGMPYHQLRP